MSKLEEMLYSAEEHGKRTDLLQRVGEIRVNNPRMKLEDIYEQAYNDVMHTQREMKCVICNVNIKDFGHNPDPINEGKGRCCEKCNFSYVIPARMLMIRRTTTNNI